jgi:hypothetical protein
MPVVSKAQAGFMGRIAGGEVEKKGLSQDKAKEFLRGVKVSELPERASSRDAVRSHNARQPKHRRANEERATDLLDTFRGRRKP